MSCESAPVEAVRLMTGGILQGLRVWCPSGSKFRSSSRAGWEHSGLQRTVGISSGVRPLCGGSSAVSKGLLFSELYDKLLIISFPLLSAFHQEAVK
jgi:hypothetical protein